MGRKVEEIQFQHHLALLRLRCQDRLVQSDDFVAAWECADDKQKKICYRLLRKLEIDKLRVWVSELINEYSVTTLRQLASNCNVKNYCNMQKDELFKALETRGIIHGKSRNSTKSNAVVSDSRKRSEKSNSN